MDVLDAESSPETHAIIGAALRVHQVFGPGFLESAYHDALAIEFRNRGIPFRHEMPIPIEYCGERIATCYRADFVAHESILLELKAVATLTKVEEAQVVHYLKATGFETGLLLNFGSTSLQVRRLTNRVRKSNGLEGSPESP